LTVTIDEDSEGERVRDKKIGVMSPGYGGSELNGAMKGKNDWFKRHPELGGGVSTAPQRTGGYERYSQKNVSAMMSSENPREREMKAICGQETRWNGLYQQMDNWKQMVVPESYVHPAKMAPLLCQKIFEHLEELKMIDPDSLVCDFMAGTGTTNIVASLRGYQSVSIELERKFVGIEAANREQLRQFMGREPRWRIMQGDSRKLSRMLNGNLTGIMSPSYGGSEQVDKRWNHQNPNAKNDLVDHDQKAGFQNSRNVGHLKTGLISPPYRNRLDQGNEEQRKRGGTLQSEMNLGGYSSNPRNVGNLSAVVSPPYQDIMIIDSAHESKQVYTSGAHEDRVGYNKANPKQIGNLRTGLVSPPYQDAINSPKSGNRAERLRMSGRDPATYMGGTGRQLDTDIKYGASKGQVGSENPETYESAMLQIYREAHKAGISPLVTVTKNPTRQGKLVRLDLITIDLLQKAGYSIFDYHQAVLFKSHDVSSVNLDGIVEKKTSQKGRIGFFKRLQMAKGSIAASWEDVIFSR
jgi:hypothetical protein